MANGLERESGSTIFSEEELREVSGVKRVGDYVEVTCGCTSHRYGDAVGRLRVFVNGYLEITCECTPGCQEGLFLSLQRWGFLFLFGFVSFCFVWVFLCCACLWFVLWWVFLTLMGVIMGLFWSASACECVMVRSYSWTVCWFVSLNLLVWYTTRSGLEGVVCCCVQLWKIFKQHLSFLCV